MERARLMYDEREECVCASSTRRSQSGRIHVHVGHRGLFPGCPSKTGQAVGMERGVGHKEPGCEGLCRYVSDRGSVPSPLHSLLIKEQKVTRPEWAVIKEKN